MEPQDSPLTGKRVRRILESETDPGGSYTGIAEGQPERDVDAD